MTYPDDVKASLVESIGAYIRARPATELPAPLRRLRDLRPKTLQRHSETLLAILDDDVQRALVLQWLTQDKPSVGKRAASVLRLATERPAGYEERLAELAAPSKRPPRAGPDLAARLDRAQSRLREARDETRRAKAASEQERRRAGELARATRKLEASLERERARAAELEKELEGARTASARAGKRHERALQRVQEERDALGRELKDLRRRLRALQAPEPAGRQRRRAAPPPPSRAAAPPPRRSALAVPKGLLGDAPETLERWLQAPGVQLVIDGYNVAKSEPRFGDLALETQRSRFVEEADRIVRRFGVPATIVFDGDVIPPGTARRSRRAAKVVYSRPQESADDHIVALLESLPTYPVVVVTSDRELQGRCARRGATIATSPQLLGLL